MIRREYMGIFWILVMFYFFLFDWELYVCFYVVKKYLVVCIQNLYIFCMLYLSIYKFGYIYINLDICIYKELIVIFVLGGRIMNLFGIYFVLLICVF